MSTPQPPGRLIITTTFTVEGHRIREYLGSCAG